MVCKIYNAGDQGLKRAVASHYLPCNYHRSIQNSAELGYAECTYAVSCSRV